MNQFRAEVEDAVRTNNRKQLVRLAQYVAEYDQEEGERLQPLLVKTMGADFHKFF